MSTITVSTGKVYVCQFCDYQVDNERGIKLHKRYSHSNIKMGKISYEHRCEICGEKFTKAEILKHAKKCYKFKR